MFKELSQEEARQAGQYDDGIHLYKAFCGAVEAKDKVRAPRLALRLDAWQNTLTPPQNAEFLAILVSSGLIPADSELGRAITMFGGQKLCIS